MKMTKHAHARFKQRQKVKNKEEMLRRLSLAVERGTLLEGVSNRPGTRCYKYSGYLFIIGNNDDTLVTLYSSKKLCKTKKHRLIDELRMRQAALEARMCLLAA